MVAMVLVYWVVSSILDFKLSCWVDTHNEVSHLTDNRVRPSQYLFSAVFGWLTVWGVLFISIIVAMERWDRRACP